MYFSTQQQFLQYRQQSCQLEFFLKEIIILNINEHNESEDMNYGNDNALVRKKS